MGLQGKARKANSAARLVSKVFNIMLADRSPMETSKRQGIFHITNLAFKVYFKLNSVRMCQTFISNINTGGLELDMFPISQQVTYKYYIGRYALYHGRLQHVIIEIAIHAEKKKKTYSYRFRLKVTSCLHSRSAMHINGTTSDWFCTTWSLHVSFWVIFHRPSCLKSIN